MFCKFIKVENIFLEFSYRQIRPTIEYIRIDTESLRRTVDASHAIHPEMYFCSYLVYFAQVIMNERPFLS